MLANYYLVGSSLLFIIPATIAQLQQFWLGYYAGLFTTIISAMYHLTKLKELFWPERLAYFLYTTSIIHICKKKGFVTLYCIPSFLCTTIYYGGYVTRTMIWDPDQRVATTWHVILHIISSGTGAIALSY